MALFGKKAKDGANDASLAGVESDDAGGVAVADDDSSSQEAPVSGKKIKAARAPKAPKNTTVKNGVAVGLNIGNQFIKAVEVTSKGGELSVTAMGAVPTPPESYTNGNVLSVSALSGAIRELWKGAGIKSKVAITSVAGTGALVVRVIEVPKMSDGELGDNMKVDADRYIPFPPSEVVMDFKALRELPSDPDAPNMEVLLAAAQREIIDLHVQVVQKARLDPRAIDVEPIAAARALQLERRSDGQNFIDYNEVTAIVNLGATGTEISILRGDILVFTRVVPGGGDVMTRAIAEGMGLPFADAERLKIESADAIAPAGYLAGGEAGESNDFNFGDDFSGGDLNSAFEDISADPTAASDDPFDLDFFNQNPQDEPGAGHAQKEGEPAGDAPSAFDFSAFSFDAPATPAATPAEPASTPEAAPAPDSGAPVSFDFGFDDLSALPSIAPTETSASDASSEKGTAKLEEPIAPETSALPNAAPTILAPGFAASPGSAFDFDNFDLPTATPENMATVSIPMEPIAVAPTPTPVSPPAPSGFDFNIPPAPADNTPINFDLEDETLASKTAPGGETPLSLEKAPLAMEPAAAAPAEESVEAASTAFDFAMSEPDPAPPLAAISTETAPVETAPVVETPAVAANAPQSGEFDLDAIFGTSATTPATTPATPSDPVGNEAPTETTPMASFGDDFEATATVPSVANSASGDDFDLSGIDTGAGDDFGAGFGASDDFSEFGAGLGAGGAGGAGVEAGALYGLISPALEELAGEVRRSLEFHLGRYPDATISRLVLLGGGARLRNLDVFLTQMIGVPTAVANPFAHITVQTPKLAPGYASENGPLCAVALGLALRDFVD